MSQSNASFPLLKLTSEHTGLLIFLNYDKICVTEFPVVTIFECVFWEH